MKFFKLLFQKKDDMQFKIAKEKLSSLLDKLSHQDNYPNNYKLIFISEIHQ